MKTDTNNETRLVNLCEMIKSWWEEHKHDATGDYGEWSTYDDEPKFVTAAKEVIGDWESKATHSHKHVETA